MDRNKLNGNYGCLRDVFYKNKMGSLYLSDYAIVISSLILGIVLSSQFFLSEMIVRKILFVLIITFISLFLVFPANGNKKNWQSIMLFFSRKRRRYISFQKNMGEDI